MDIIQGLKPGVFLFNNTYRIEKVLGQGGFGITYLAFDMTLERYVAIKEFFPKDYCDREEFTSHVTVGTQNAVEFVNKLKSKFLKEAKNIAKLNHPSIIKIHTAFEENQTAYYVMDFIEGQNLSNKVKNSGPIPPQAAIRYIKLAGKALEYVHSRKINHFDIKPANILIRESDDLPILIDFGLSKQYDSEGKQTSTTPTGMSHGYAPMEQYSATGIKQFSPQTDLYSLGATLYYLLSGIVPPQATQLIDEELTFPPSIPISLIKPISKAMSSGRKKRHESVALFIEDLENSYKELNSDLMEESMIKREQNHHNYSLDDLEDKTSFLEEKKPSFRFRWMIITACMVIISLVFFYIVKDFKSEERKVSYDDDIVTVSDLYWESPLGASLYSGEVLVDSINGEQIPNGRGVAKIINGSFEGGVYDGEFINGKMEGETVYKLKNGDVFEGTFKDNQYERGRYTIDEDGSYFEGTFKNMETDKGEWRDNKGNLLQ